MRGTIKTLVDARGFGFIKPAGGGHKDVFFHMSAVQDRGYFDLREGQEVEYGLEDGTEGERQRAAYVRPAGGS